MRCALLGIALAALFAIPSLAASDPAVLDSAALAALQARWPVPMLLVRKRIDGLPEMFARDRAAAIAVLLSAAAFAQADERPEADRAAAKIAAVRDFQSRLYVLGPQSGLFLSPDGGLGAIARDVLGEPAFAEVLKNRGGQKKETAALLSLRAESSYRAGKYKDAEAAAHEALTSNPEDHDAFAILKLCEGRVVPIKTARPQAGEADASPTPGALAPGGDAVLPEARLPLALRHAAVAPPSPAGIPALDPKAADYWDRQLLAPLLKRSDANPVAREYLSPLLKANKVTIRLDRENDNPDVKGNWGYYDLESSVIHYCLGMGPRSSRRPALGRSAS